MDKPQGVIQPVGWTVLGKQFGREIAYGPFPTREDAREWIAGSRSEMFRMTARTRPVIAPAERGD